MLIFHQSLAPYRVDLWNSLNRSYDLKMYFAFDNVINQKFDQEALKAKLDFRINYIKTGFNVFKRAFRWGFLPIIRSFNPDIIISQEFSQTTAWLLLLRSIFGFKYTVFTICDDSLLIASTTTGGIRKAFRNYVVPRLDGLILVNRQVADWYEEKYNIQGKTIIYPIVYNDPIFQQQLEAALPASNQLIEKHNLAGTKCIFYFGRIAVEKGLDRLLLAFSKIHHDFEDARVVMVGDGNQRKPLEALAEKLGISEKVLFPGRTEGLELYAWFNIAPLMVLPSQYEPFGAVVSELLLSGAEVLCSTAAGAFQMVEPGVNGDIFDPYDIDKLSLLLKKQLLKMDTVESMRHIRLSKMPATYDDYMCTLQNALNGERNEIALMSAV